MITFKDYKEYYKNLERDLNSEYLENIYREICINNMHNYFHAFIREKIKNGLNYSTEELYNWCITLETIFGIKTVRNGKTEV